MILIPTFVLGPPQRKNPAPIKHLKQWQDSSHTALLASTICKIPSIYWGMHDLLETFAQNIVKIYCYKSVALLLLFFFSSSICCTFWYSNLFIQKATHSFYLLLSFLFLLYFVLLLKGLRWGLSNLPILISLCIFTTLTEYYNDNALKISTTW